MVRPYYAEINLDNIKHNILEIKKLVKDKTIIAVIKADGYGHGAVEVVKVLKEEGIDFFAVAMISEAQELREAGFKDNILVLGYTPEEYYSYAIENNITLTIYDFDLAQKLNNVAEKKGKIAKVHIKIDTGMGRLGFQTTLEDIEKIKEISKLKNLCLEGIYSHFATADDEDKSFAYMQIDRFKKVVETLSKEGVSFKIKHMANSGAILDLSEAYFDAVRPGIMIYGYYPSDKVNTNKINLKPAMSLKAKVAFVKNVEKGTSISYGRRFIAQNEMKIATLPFGYADGFSRIMTGNAKVLVKNKEAQVVGTICMDQCMIDVTHIEDIKIGDEVVVMGEMGNFKITADDIAQRINTICYEVLCMVSKRVPRVYVKNNQNVI